MNGPLPPADCDLPATKLRPRYGHSVSSFSSFETVHTHTQCAFQHRWQHVKMRTATRGFTMFSFRYNLNMSRLFLHICRWISSICFQNLQKLCKLYQESHFVIQRRFLMDGRFLAHRPTKTHFSWPKKHPQSVQEHVANTLEYSEFMSFHVILCYVMFSNVMFSQFAD